MKSHDMNPSRGPWRLFFSIVKETFPFILICFFILTTLVFLQQVGKHSIIILSIQSSPKIAATILGSLIPGIVVITLPVSLLLGTVIACSRLSVDSELIAAQSLGISKINLALPFIFFGIIGTGITFYLSCNIAPQSLRQLKTLRDKIILNEAANQIRPHTFINTFPNVLMYVQNIDYATGDWLGVFILQQDNDQSISRVLTSERGQLRITSEPRVALEAELLKGFSLENRLNTQEASQATSVTSGFDKLSIKLTEKSDGIGADAEAPDSVQEMTIRELTAFAKSAPTPKERIQALVEWHKRIAFSMACLTLTCVTFIIALRGRRFSTRPRTFIVIIFIAMVFYLLLVAGQNQAHAGNLPVWLGVWLSNILLGIYVLKSLITNSQLSPLIIRYFSLPVHVLPIPRLEINGWFRREGDSGITRQSRLPFRFNLINLINYLIVSEIAKYYLLALSTLVVTSIIFTLFDVIPAMSRSGTTIGYASSYLAYLSPQFAYFLSPFALLVAILTGCTVLARSNQLVILYGAGQSKYRIIAAILIAALTLGFGLWLLSDYILPTSNREQDIRYSKIRGRQIEQNTLAMGKKWVYGKNNIIYSYQRIESDNSLMNVSMYNLSPSSGTLERATHFGSAAQISPTAWRASDGWTEIINPDLNIERHTLANDNQLITIEDGPVLFNRTINESSKMSSDQLRDYINQLKDVGIATSELQLDLVKRVVFPFSCLTLALMAVPFATTQRARKSSPLGGVAIGVGISLVFWLLMTIFEAAGKQASLPVAMAVWGPQVLFLAVGMYLNFKYRSE
jgi:LPS export ABC transporter permease LptG